MTSMGRLLAALGVEDTRQLCERLGGTCIYIPIVPNKALLLAVGRQAAARLCDAMAGEYLRLPSRLAQERRRRREAIRYDLRRGLPVAETAIRNGVSDRYVRALRACEDV
jgi:hypothetical protein